MLSLYSLMFAGPVTDPIRPVYYSMIYSLGQDVFIDKAA